MHTHFLSLCFYQGNSYSLSGTRREVFSFRSDCERRNGRAGAPRTPQTRNEDKPDPCEVKTHKGKGEKDRMNKIIGAMVLAMACCQASAKMVLSDMSMAMFRSARIKEPTVFKAKVVIADWDSIWYQERGPM